MKYRIAGIAAMCLMAVTACLASVWQSDDANQRDNEERSGDPTCQARSDRIEHLGCSDVISWLLLCEGELISVRTHLGCEGRERHSCKDKILLPQ